MNEKESIPIEDVLEPESMAYRVPLSIAFPELAKLWLYERNCGYGPQSFSFGSSVAAWWQCPDDSGHKYQLSIRERVRHHQGHGATGCDRCPVGLRQKKTQSESKPEIAKDWQPNFSCSHDHGARTVWWRCPADPNHIWRARVGRPCKCPICQARQ